MSVQNKKPKNKEKSENAENSHENQKPDKNSVMLKPREIIPIMAQTSDPLGSYTGIPAGAPFEKPVQDADDL
jgi:hypothetical protein